MDNTIRCMVSISFYLPLIQTVLQFFTLVIRAVLVPAFLQKDTLGDPAFELVDNPVQED